MFDVACPGIHRWPDAAHEVLKARIGANWVPLRVNIQPGHWLALSERFFERLHRQVLLSQCGVRPGKARKRNIRAFGSPMLVVRQLDLQSAFVPATRKSDLYALGHLRCSSKHRL